MTLKFTKSGLDLISISRFTSYCNEWPRLIWPTLYNITFRIHMLTVTEKPNTKYGYDHLLLSEMYAFDVCAILLVSRRRRLGITHRGVVRSS